MSRIRPYLPLLVVTAVAAVLRLYQLDVIDVRFDEASAPQQARDIANGMLRAFASFSGSVANHPPLYLYLLAIPYLFTQDLLAIAAFRQLVDVAAVGVTWLLARRYFNARVALIAALLFAVAPWAIQLSRKLGIITPPLFVLVWLWGACEVLLRRAPRGWALLGLGLALSLGAHFSAVYLLPATAAVIALGWRSINRRVALAGLAPLALLAAVYFGADAAQGWPNARAMLSSESGAPSFQPLVFRMALWSTGGERVSDLTSGAYPLWAAQAPGWLTWIDSAQMVLVVLSFALLIVLIAARRVQGDAAHFWIVLIVWQLVPLLLLARSARAPQLHYFMPMWPGAWLLLAWMLDWVLRHAPVAARAACVSVLALILGWQVVTTLRFTDFVQRHDTALGGYGDPVRAALAAAEAARVGVRNGRYSDVIVVVPRDNPYTDEPATVLDVALAELPRRFVRADVAQIQRPDAAQYLFAPGTDDALQRLLARAPAPYARFVTRPDAPRSYALVQVDSPALPAMQPADARWANGARLIGYTASRDRAALRATIYLRVDAIGAPNQHWFLRAFDEDSAQLGSQDIPGVAPSQWRVGDVLALSFAFDLSSADADVRNLRIGSYAYPEIQQTAIVDAAGNPADDGVTVAFPDP